MDITLFPFSFWEYSLLEVFVLHKVQNTLAFQVDIWLPFFSKVGFTTTFNHQYKEAILVRKKHLIFSFLLLAPS